MRVFATLAVATGFAVPLLGGCIPIGGCNDIGVFEGVAVTVALPPGETLAAAAGRLSIGRESYEFTCGSSPAPAGYPSCTFSESIIYIHIDVDDQPKSIGLALVLNEGEFTFEDSVRPSYETSTPWGGGSCGVATVGSATVTPSPNVQM